MKTLIKENLRDLLNEQRFAVIATQGKNEPYTDLVTFLVTNDLTKIYFPTSKTTKKYENISGNARISILFDNRGNTPADIENAMTVTAVGTTKETFEKQINTLFSQKHPYLTAFVNSPDTIMIEIDVEKYIVVNNFQNVNILNPKEKNDTKEKNHPS